MKKLFTLFLAMFISAAFVQAQVLVDFETTETTVSFGSWGGAGFTQIDNPHSGGINTSASVGEFSHDGGGGYIGIETDGMFTDFDFSATPYFRIKVWVDEPVEIIFKLQNNPNWGENSELKYAVSQEETSQWIELAFNFGAVTATNYNRVVLYFDGGNSIPSGAGHKYYFDDISKSNTPSAVTHIDFDTKNEDIVFESWNQSSTFAKVANPDSDGINTSAFVGQFTSGNDNGIGVGIKDATDVFVTPFDFSDINYFKMKVWSDHEADVTFHLENMPEWGNNVEVSSSITSTQLNQWVELTFDFTGVTKDLMNNIVIKVGGSNTTEGSVIYFDDIKGPALSTAPVLPAPSLPIDFEEGTVYDYTWTGFGADDWGAIHVAVVANPDASGINVSETVVEINKGAGAQTWAGASLNLAGAVDFTNGTIINIKAYSPRADIPVLLKMEDSNSAPDGNGNPSVFVEVSATVTSSDTWETLEFDISTATGFDAANSYDRVIIFPDFNAVGADEVFYFDDIKFKEDATGFEELDAVIFNVYPNPASDYLFISNISNLKRIDIYSVTGQKIKTIEAIENRIQISELPQGVYVISAENNSGEVFSTKFFKK